MVKEGKATPLSPEQLGGLPREQMLCEARNHAPCLEEKCPLFRSKKTEVGGEYGICSEFKIAFKKL